MTRERQQVQEAPGRSWEPVLRGTDRQMGGRTEGCQPGQVPPPRQVPPFLCNRSPTSQHQLVAGTTEVYFSPSWRLEAQGHSGDRFFYVWAVLGRLLPVSPRDHLLCVSVS